MVSVAGWERGQGRRGGGAGGELGASSSVARSAVMAGRSRRAGVADHGTSRRMVQRASYPVPPVAVP
jgi:hypothetical protein